MKTLRTVSVSLGDNSYPIYIGSGVLAQADLLATHIDTQQIAIVTDRVVAKLYLSLLENSLRRNHPQLQLQVILLPEGESNKNQDTLNLIYDHLIEKKFSRDCLLIALGGGIVGDITGYAAASYQRGVKFIQIPTTLYVLNSLPARELAAGMAEVIKYGLIRDAAFLGRLDTIIDEVMALNPEFIGEVIELSCQHKADVVAADEKEKGERATLNLGHTFGHAIETLTHYHTYLHGEAVAIGTMMALTLSRQLGWLEESDVHFAEQLFKRVNCPTETMQRDKKVAAGKLKLILLKSLGHAVIRNDIAEEAILTAIQRKCV